MPSDRPVVNEVAEALAARANRDTGEPQHPRLRARTGDYLSMSEAILEMPKVHTAFEAQAKLEAGELVPANVRSEALRELLYAAKAVWAHRDQFDDQRWERLGLALNRWQDEEGGESS